MNEWLEFIARISHYLAILWGFSGLILTINIWRKKDPNSYKYTYWLWAELKPFYWPCVATYFLITAHEHSVVKNTLDSIAVIIIWLIYKDAGKDDRWKRRAKKVLGKIKQIGTRLIVVPNT